MKCFIYVDLNIFQVNNARIYIPTHKLLGIVLVRLGVSQYIFKVEETTRHFLGKHSCLLCFNICYCFFPAILYKLIQTIPNLIQIISLIQYSCLYFETSTQNFQTQVFCHVAEGKMLMLKIHKY